MIYVAVSLPMGSSGKRKFTQVKAHWTPANHEVFINLCLEQISAGNKPGAHFNIQGWKNILDSFQSITGLEYDRIQLKNHWDMTKKQWKAWHNLVSNERLKWDPCTRRFGASDQEWDEIIKENPDAAPFRSKELPLADKLELIYGETADLEVTEKHNLGGKNVNCFIEAEPITSWHNYADEKEAPNPPYGYGLMNTEEPIVVGPEHNDAVESRSNVTIQSPPFKFSYSIAECIKCLDSIDEIEQGSELYLFALDIFLKKDYREIFLNLKKSSTRVAWLTRLQSVGPPLPLC